jgi:BspA type Leucine rich repeat region (6 copies)/Secretion system C-terminal sorting domain/Putative binding domain, N-terminal/Viral BACON domain
MGPVKGTITIPSSVTHIGAYAFMGCQNIDSLIFLPSSGTFIDESAFRYCYGLKSLIMYSPSVNHVSLYGFYDCTSLSSVIYPSSLTSMGAAVFRSCSGLKSIRMNPLIPPVIPASNGIFTYISTAAINLYVPTGTKDAYAAAQTWSGFNIIEYDLHLSASAESLNMADTAGSTAIFDIYASTNWQISSNQSWLIANRAYGMDSASIKLMVEANEDTIAREALISITGENVAPQTVVVSQAPRPTLNVSASVLNIASLALSTTGFSISSNQDWSLQSDQAWLTVNSSSGSGDNEIILTADANPDTTAREARVTVSTGRLPSKIIVVTQTAKQFLLLSSNQLNIGASSGSTTNFSIESNTDWTIQSDQSWLAVSSSSGNRNALITLTAEANPETSPREATVSAMGEGLPAQILEVTQEAAIPSGFSVSKPESIMIYPNPVKDILTIYGAAALDLHLFDLQGRLIISQSLHGNYESIDLSALPSGEYLIKIGDKRLRLVK